MTVSNVVYQGTMTGRTITHVRVTYWRISPLRHGSQVMDRALTWNLDMALQTISLYQKGNITSNIYLVVTG